MKLHLTIPVLAIVAISACGTGETKQTNEHNNEEYTLRSSLEAVHATETLHLYDSTITGDSSYFIRFKDVVYTKQTKQLFDSGGVFTNSIMYSPEGIKSFGKELVLDADSSMLSKKVLKIQGDSVLSPVKALLLEFNKDLKICYAKVDSNRLFVIEVR